MIVQNPNKILRQISKEIPAEKIKSAEIKEIIKEMKKELLLSAEYDGVAVAAPQIGQNLRIFVILKELIDLSKGKKTEEAENKKMDLKKAINEGRFMVFINPQILKKSKKNMLVAEGCLSVKGYQGKIKRAEKVTVKAFDEDACEFEIAATKILSQAMQHEIDHLDGVLFIDKAEEVQKIRS